MLQEDEQFTDLEEKVLDIIKIVSVENHPEVQESAVVFDNFEMNIGASTSQHIIQSIETTAEIDRSIRRRFYISG